MIAQAKALGARVGLFVDSPTRRAMPWPSTGADRVGCTEPHAAAGAPDQPPPAGDACAAAATRLPGWA